MWFHDFPKGICPKVIGRLKFELAYYDVLVHAHLAGAVEYTDSNSADGIRTSQKVS